MPRIILEDMKVNKKKELPTKREEVFSPRPIEKSRDFYKEEIKKEKVVERIKLGRTPSVKKQSKILHKRTVIIFVFCIILAIIYWGGNIFHKANITITSKHQIITYNKKPFVASKEEDTNPINFEIMILSDKKTKNTILTNSKEVSLKSKGSIIIYNEFATTPQKLLAGMFISDNDGKAYKIDTTVTVPGYKLDKDKKIIRGEVTANITSFLPGESYNGSPSDFYITSFKGTPKYTKIYGKLKTELTGGANGLVYVIDDASKTDIESNLGSSLKDDLLRQVKAQIPPGYILYPNALTFSYKIQDDFVSKTQEAKVPVEGILSVVLLQEKSLMDNIIKISLPNISKDELEEIKITDLDELSFNFTDKDQVINKDMSTLSFTLGGSIDAVWNPRVDILKSKLLGIHKNNAVAIFKEDPGISSAIVEIFPPWKKYIPDDLLKINIIVK